MDGWMDGWKKDGWIDSVRISGQETVSFVKLVLIIPMLEDCV